MNNDESFVFEQVLNALDLPEPDLVTKERIMKAVYLLMVAKEIGLFHVSIPGTLLDDTTYE
ncbi:MAG: hypothetical protein NPIRA02_19800 [Nitrospirales bacterium]|nr:MAG: hypothetical protein NPIRA02_19800 [Nitrospirales bacterium]